MNTTTRYLVFFLGFFLLVSCDQNKTETLDTGDKDQPPKDRNMFGLNIPRGLTKTSEDLAPGYVMFAVPNSARVPSSWFDIDQSWSVRRPPGSLAP